MKTKENNIPVNKGLSDKEVFALFDEVSSQYDRYLELTTFNKDILIEKESFEEEAAVRDINYPLSIIIR